MPSESYEAVGQVLKEAAEHEHFFDLSDAERLTWMIQRAYEMGRTAAIRNDPAGQSQGCPIWSPKKQTYR